ncbi:hypothetical protein K3495_g16099, partial [Podosphaera aphanis]
LVNYFPTAANEFESPHFRLYHEKPPISKLKAIGCECWKPVPREVGLRKLDNRAEKCYLLGYGNGSNLYRVWNSDSERVELVRDLRFEENTFVPSNLHIPETASHAGVIDQRIIQENVNTWRSVKNKRIALFEGESRCSNIAPDIAGLTEISSLISVEGKFNEEYRLADPDTDPLLIASQLDSLNQLNDDGFEGDLIMAITSLICSLEQNQGKEWLTLPAEITRTLNLLEPKTYEAAINGGESAKWSVAIQGETDSLIKNKTFIIAERPANKRVLSGRYVFKIKVDSEGKPDRYKARWVVRGFEQDQ